MPPTRREEGVEEEVGVHSVPTRSWAVQSVFLVLTSACNLRCTYCYNRRDAPARMPWPTVKAAVARLWESPERDVSLLITGGEPLLEYPLVRRLVKFVRETTPRGRRVSIHLLTNGTRLGGEEIAFLARHRVSVQISFDGVEACQRFRGAWTFSRLDSLFTHLRRRHRSWFESRVNVAVTLVPGTVAHLAESVEFLLHRGLTSITVSPAAGDVPGWQVGMISLLDEQFARVYRLSLNHYRRTGLVPLTLFHKTSPHPPCSALCGAEQASMPVVDVDGTVYGCNPVVGSALYRPRGLLRRASDAMRIGHVSDRALAERLPSFGEALDATGLFGPRGENYSSYGACRDCRYVRYCNVCPLWIALVPGARDPRRVPDFVCAFTRVSLKYRHRFPRQPDGQ